MYRFPTTFLRWKTKLAPGPPLVEERRIGRSGQLGPRGDRPPLRLRAGQDFLEPWERGFGDDHRPAAYPPAADLLQESRDRPLVPLATTPLDGGVAVQRAVQAHLLRGRQVG